MRKLATLLGLSLLLAACASDPVKLPDPTVAPYPSPPASLMKPPVRPKAIVGQ